MEPRKRFDDPTRAGRAVKDSSSDSSEASRPTETVAPTLDHGTGAGPATAMRAALNAMAILEPGIVLGHRYQILEMLGIGGMGAVYKALDREVDRIVALKIIRPDLADNAHILQRFKQELVLARQITHRNVIRIYDLGEADGIKFITMEYIHGESLIAVLQREGKLPPKQAAQIIESVCMALEVAHAEKVIHRDLKPANIMRDRQGRTVVMDFGLAHLMQTPAGPLGERKFETAETAASVTHGAKLDSFRSMPGSLVGTPQYMSPEQARREEADVRSDIYTIGLIFYELLTGETPFQGDDLATTLQRRIQEKPRPLAEINPHIPRAVTHIVGKCLEREREARYQEVAELLRDLRGWLYPARRAGKWAAASVVVLLLAGTQIFLQQKASRKPAAEHAPVSVLISDFTNETGNAVFDGTLEPAFSIALEGASFINNYNRIAAHKIAAKLQPGATTLDQTLARLVATREGINVVVNGDISSQGNSYDLKIGALDAISGKRLATAEETTDKNHVLLTIGKLAADVRKALGDKTPQSVQLSAAETYTTRSLEAAHEYALAQDMQSAGKLNDAVVHYQRAVQYDPDLGRAYVGLANLYHNTGQTQEAEKYYQVALSKLDHMSDREKYRTRGAYYLAIHDPDKALEQQLALVKEYPSDTAGIANLAYAYFLRRDMANALQTSRKALAIYPQNLLFKNNVGLFAMYAGDFDAAIEEQRGVIETNPSFVLGYVGLALAQLGKGHPDEAIATYSKLQSLGPQGPSPAFSGLADVALYQGRAPDAIKLLNQGIVTDLADKNADGAAEKLSILEQADLMQGEAGNAVRAADRALAQSRETGIMFWAARAYIVAGQPQKAMALAQRLANQLQADPQAYAKLIAGEADLKSGNPREALKRFLESRKIADTWMGRFDAARAYIQADAFEEAESDLDDCLKRRGEATALFLDENPTYFLFPAVYYYLGRAQEGLRSPAAVESFKLFLATQVEGSHDPLLIDARRRVIALSK